MIVGARQNFHLFGQNTWYLKNNRDLIKFLYDFAIFTYYHQIIKKNQSIKANFVYSLALRQINLGL